MASLCCLWYCSITLPSHIIVFASGRRYHASVLGGKVYLRYSFYMIAVHHVSVKGHVHEAAGTAPIGQWLLLLFTPRNCSVREGLEARTANGDSPC